MREPAESIGLPLFKLDLRTNHVSMITLRFVMMYRLFDQSLKSDFAINR